MQKCSKCKQDLPLSSYKLINKNKYAKECLVCTEKRLLSRKKKANKGFEECKEGESYYIGFLSSKIGTKIHDALKYVTNSKRVIEYLECDIATYKAYLESRFVEGMSWDNYGTEWEIDHIIPTKYQNPTIEESGKAVTLYKHSAFMGKNECVEKQ